MPPTVNEEKLKLEQLRAIDNGLPINVLELELKNSWGIDTKEDLKKLRSSLNQINDGFNKKQWPKFKI